MQCEYCEKVLKTQSSLKFHQKTAKYCLAKQNIVPDEHTCSSCNIGFTLKSSLNSHLTICKVKKELEASLKKEESIKAEYEKQKTLESCLLREENLRITLEKQKQIIRELKQKLVEKDRIIQDQKIVIEEQKILIKESHCDYKKQLHTQIKDLQDRMQSMAEKAIDKPSTVQNTTNQIINNLLPITTEHLDEQVQYLTIDHVKHGAVGYAKYALEHPLKDRLVCTDTSRKKGKYKDSDGNIVSDPEMASITKKLFLAIKDRNSELITEYANDLKVKLDSFGFSSNNEMTTEEADEVTCLTDELINLVTSIFSQKRQSNEISDGLKPDLYHQFVKEIATGAYRSN
jgi:hypothetical protein